MGKAFILCSILLLVCFSSTNIYGTWNQGYCKNGQGTFTFSDGSKYLGKWKNDKREGEGIIIYPDGKKKVGRVEEEKPTGR